MRQNNKFEIVKAIYSISWTPSTTFIERIQCHWNDYMYGRTSINKSLISHPTIKTLIINAGVSPWNRYKIDKNSHYVGIVTLNWDHRCSQAIKRSRVKTSIALFKRKKCTGQSKTIVILSLVLFMFGVMLL